MAQADKNNGPGLEGIFLDQYPAYSYQGPIDMRYATFTPSALNRFVGQSPITEDFISNQRIAKGQKFVDEAKFLNDIYGLVKNTVSLYNPEHAENVAPLVLTDEIVPGATAWYTPRYHQIFQPVYGTLPQSGYYNNPAETVIGFDSQNQPTQYIDYFVSEKGKQIPVYASPLPHEIGHSLDEFQGIPLSQHNQNLWDYVTKDWYLYPREYNSRTTKPEAFAEYFSDAMQSGYVNKLPQLQELYRQTSQYLPYGLEDIGQISSSNPDGGIDDALVSEVLNTAMQLSNKAAKKTGVRSKKNESKANYEGSRQAKKEMFKIMSDVSGFPNNESGYEQLQNALDIQRAKEHLNFLNYFLRPEEEAPSQDESSYFTPFYPR